MISQLLFHWFLELREDKMVGIICFWDRYATPYLQKYEEMLIANCVNYEVVFWNRGLVKTKPSVTKNNNYIYINRYCANGYKKVLSFFQWRRDVKKIINERKYKNLIILSTVPAILLRGIILKYYSGKYLFDIRDYTLEKNHFFRSLVMSLINGSSLTAISSKGYMKWLDYSPKIMVNHNITISNSNYFDVPSFDPSKPLRFSFVGNVRLDSQTRAMLLTMGKSNFIEQHYYGRILTVCDIEKTISQEGLTNVMLHGPFSVADKDTIYKETDLINTVYANAEREEDIPLGDSTPLPNRLYDALVYYRPLVTSRGTYLAELSDKYHLGVNVNGFDPEIENHILQYVKNFNKEQFVEGCDTLRREVMEEERAFMQMINQIFINWKNNGN